MLSIHHFWLNDHFFVTNRRIRRRENFDIVIFKLYLQV